MTKKEVVDEYPASWLPRRVGRLPGDQQRHHGGLAAAGRHLHGDAEEFRIGVRVRVFELRQQVFPPGLRRYFGQPDDRLNGLQLAEEEGLFPGNVAPVLQQALRGVRDAPLVLPKLAPRLDLAADFVDPGILPDLLLRTPDASRSSASCWAAFFWPVRFLGAEPASDTRWAAGRSR